MSENGVLVRNQKKGGGGRLNATTIHIPSISYLDLNGLIGAGFEGAVLNILLELEKVSIKEHILCSYPFFKIPNRRF